MFKRLKNRSIKHKLITIIMGITCVVLLATTVIRMTVDYANLHKSIVGNITMTADFTAQNIGHALYDLDVGTVQQSLQAFSFNKKIAFACVFLPDGGLFAHHHNASYQEKCPNSYHPDQQGQGYFNKVDIHRSIIGVQGNLGALYVEYDLSQDHWHFFLKEVFGLMLVFVALVAAYFLASWLQAPITSPILHLTGIAARSAAKQDFSIRATKQNDDELGFLVDMFNKMLKTVQERDVTIIKAKEEAEKARDEADSANAMKSDFLAMMSHEIRTPMNGVIGMTELLLDTELNHKQRSHALTVINSADALLNIINDILDFSKIEAGKFELEPISFDLMQVVEDTAELLSVRAREKAVELIVQYVPDTPQYLIGDPGRIRQIISNLAGNAIKFTNKGHVLIKVEEDKKALLNDNRHRLKISVKDTGIGIPLEKQDRLFKKFSQADTSTTRKFGGTGLGLAISKQFSQMMDGDVGVISAEGEGSTFWLTMTLDKDLKADEIPPAPDILQGVKVLIVDDVLANGTLLTERFLSLGMVPDFTSQPLDVVEMMAKAHEQGQPYQMAVLDYLMPSINGEELARQIKDHSTLKDTALVMLTSAGGAGYTERFEKAGFSAFMSKPVRAQELASTMALVWQEFSTGNQQQLISLAQANEPYQDKVSDTVNFENTRILLAEDNRTNQAFAQEILEGAGCTVDIAINGKEAINFVSHQPYDLIFMDCEMPEMDGLEASQILTEMKGDSIIPDIPIIALTANAIKGDKERCLNAGMTDYLTKPVRRAQLFDAISVHVPPETILENSRKAS